MKDKHGEVYPDHHGDWSQYQGAGDIRVYDLVRRLGRRRPWYVRTDVQGAHYLVLPMDEVPGSNINAAQKVMTWSQAFGPLTRYETAVPQQQRAVPREIVNEIALAFFSRESGPAGIEVPGDNPTYRAIRHRGLK